MGKKKWKAIDGYEGLYEVSNYGEVKSLQREVRYSETKIAVRKERLLKPSTNEDGYDTVCLQKDGKRKYLLVHRLVAMAFIPTDDFNLQVNHKNTVKNDNRVDNLEWCTMEYNINHFLEIDHRRPYKGEKHYASKLSNEQAKEVRNKLDAGESNIELAREFGVDKNVIWRIKKKLSYKNI